MDIEILQPYEFEVKNVDSKKHWTELRHNGVQFHEPYTPLPNGVKLLYNGQPVDLEKTSTNNELNLTAEECAVFFAKQILSDERNKKDYTRTELFINNFFTYWKLVLKNSKNKDLVKANFTDFDFSRIADYLRQQLLAEKKIRTHSSKKEKATSKEEKEGNKQLYGYALVDGELFDIATYMVEPPSLFIGHNSPNQGKIKKRLQPSDITLNMSKKFVPKCYERGIPCVWGSVVEEPTKKWLVSWRDSITRETKYIYIGRSVSKWVLESDTLKFDKARRLNKYIDSVRSKYLADLKSSSLYRQQFGLAVYFLDLLSIRPGDDKDEELEADTVGLTTLKQSNVRLLGDDKVEFDFYGKSSIKFLKVIKISPDAYSVLKNLINPSRDKIFDLDANKLNDYLKKLHPELSDLSAKVFRTWKASTTLERELLALGRPQPELSELRKKHLLNEACGKVAEALNHRRTVDMEAQALKIKSKIDKIVEGKRVANKDEQIANLNQQLEQYSISTATSKQNYNDPRIFVVWAKKWQMPIEKIYSKEMLKKFNWAMKTKMDWRF